MPLHDWTHSRYRYHRDRLLPFMCVTVMKGIAGISIIEIDCYRSCVSQSWTVTVDLYDSDTCYAFTWLWHTWTVTVDLYDSDTAIPFSVWHTQSMIAIPAMPLHDCDTHWTGRYHDRSAMPLHDCDTHEPVAIIEPVTVHDCDTHWTVTVSLS